MLLYSLLFQSTYHFCISLLVFAISFTITKYCRLGGLNNRNVFPHSSGGWEVQHQGARKSGFW